ncbi:N-acetylneuraminate epimerase [Pirellula sp. SH-Sr6A]|uniref:Kelch repeat-containing protein n=1 Tax=Pirellula sp. SH-Sr6A TaxID=1632865 RepID=UPI00078B74DE|nr:kelch repeat-containing protein [Pirellula sp. SH-Sr6A]AMV34162.1 N-acetylneuraminate epimerase [Pirellula sp. SH-Sr6A]
MKRTFFWSASFALFLSSLPGLAQAHFPWLVRGDHGKLIYYFGEGIADQSYKMPDSLAGGKFVELSLDGKTTPLTLNKIETADLVGCTSDKPVSRDGLFVAEATYGVYKGTRLQYISMHQSHAPYVARQPIAEPSKLPKLFAEIIDTEEGIDVYAWNAGKPFAKTKVTLYNSTGDELASGDTNDDGKVAFEDKILRQGVLGIMFGTSDPSAGQLHDTRYETESTYFTATFLAPELPTQDVTKRLPPLPFPTTSFGAVHTDHYLYVYGGNTGDAHSYSEEGQSNKLLELDLQNTSPQWREIAIGDRLQGLGMVAHGSKLILIGGFSAKNKAGDPQDLHSQASVQAFDRKTKTWSKLPSLPEPRSSHDAAIIGDTIYVVGGWAMAGKEETKWHETAWSMNLSDEQPKWNAIPNPPFVRRAVATVAHHGKIFVIGGMDKKGPTKEVAIYDPATKSWTESTSLLGDQAMAGFGAAGWSLNGSLFVSTHEGDMLRWDDSTKKWDLIGRSISPRFFHRFLPIDSKVLVSIGGASMEEGKFVQLEAFAIRDRE